MNRHTAALNVSTHRTVSSQKLVLFTLTEYLGNRGCPKIVNLGASRTDLFYERRRLGVHICILSHHKKLTTWRHRLQEGVVMLSAICKAAVALLYMIHVFSLKVHQYIVVIHHIFKDKLDREWQVQLPQDFPDLQRSYGWMLRFNKMHVWSITHLKCCMSTFGGVIREIEMSSLHERTYRWFEY